MNTQITSWLFLVRDNCVINPINTLQHCEFRMRKALHKPWTLTENVRPIDKHRMPECIVQCEHTFQATKARSRLGPRSWWCSNGLSMGCHGADRTSLPRDLKQESQSARGPCMAYTSNEDLWLKIPKISPRHGDTSRLKPPQAGRYGRWVREPRGADERPM